MKKSYIPNTITAFSLLSGFLSIIFTSKGDFQLAAVMIFAASIFDLIDGIVARLLKTTSQFGVELDSLADVVSFGAAPAFLIYSFHFYQLDTLGIVISALPLIFGAMRLARFNSQLVEIETKGDFKGLPIPLSAITIAMFVYYVHNNGEFIKPLFYISVPLILLVSIAMVSNIKYSAFPKLNRTTLRGKPIYLFLTVVGLILIFLTDGTALFYIFLGIVLFGIFRHFIKRIIGSKEENFDLNKKQI
ncbi:MAG: CDP-diacylglycerol--serine O-phosphatidyltransferase [Ignavibacteriales bacterium]|nr:CDP-diacylglycerol--serine O-phosphatidyltransferase [Ignavibacteriales bacterium]MCB9210570.1 CDP-diacylglycerol--serine O-phosphatidyltransferase [Ignavibacteriales bacterium]MCB9219945.1 CDP-diacylglycerol--serine O-phosphatidyltransferase [Ignavibacteriales bacterium]